MCMSAKYPLLLFENGSVCLNLTLCFRGSSISVILCQYRDIKNFKMKTMQMYISSKVYFEGNIKGR